MQYCFLELEKVYRNYNSFMIENLMLVCKYFVLLDGYLGLLFVHALLLEILNKAPIKIEVLKTLCS